MGEVILTSLIVFKDNAEIYKHLMVTVKHITLNLEEELVCKALKFAGITRSDQELERLDESAYEAQKALIASTTTATRYYFGTLKLTLNQVQFSNLMSLVLAYSNLICNQATLLEVVEGPPF